MIKRWGNNRGRFGSKAGFWNGFQSPEDRDVIPLNAARSGFRPPLPHPATSANPLTLYAWRPVLLRRGNNGRRHHVGGQKGHEEPQQHSSKEGAVDGLLLARDRAPAQTGIQGRRPAWSPRSLPRRQSGTPFRRTVRAPGGMPETRSSDLARLSGQNPHQTPARTRQPT